MAPDIDFEDEITCVEDIFNLSIGRGRTHNIPRSKEDISHTGAAPSTNEEAYTQEVFPMFGWYVAAVLKKIKAFD